MDKKWSVSSVAKAHGYLNVREEAVVHKEFGSWISKQFEDNDATIFDVGCGNGRVIYSLPPYERYVGIDINQSSIDAAKKSFSSSGSAVFYLQDIEEELAEEVLQEIQKCEVCYIDSVFAMLENPKKVLQEILVPNFDVIYLNRMSFHDVSSIAVSSSYNWKGMGGSSILWKLSSDFLKDALAGTKAVYQSKGNISVIICN